MQKTWLMSILLVLSVFLSVTIHAADRVVVVPLGGKKPAGDAVAGDVLEGRTFSNKDDVGIAGSMVDNGAVTFTPGTTDKPVDQGYHSGSGIVQGDIYLAPANIKSGTTIFGVSGTSIEASGTATPFQVLLGRTFSNASGPATGSMPNVGTQTITPGPTPQTITWGYHTGSGTVQGDASLVPANIKSGTTIFGVSGDTNVVDTTSGDAADAEMLSGKKAWVDGVEVTGIVPSGASLNGPDGARSFPIPDGLYSGSKTATANDAALVAENICLGVTIFGVVGTRPCAPPGTVISGGRIWMDRNLGASQVATSPTDSLAYGDLYQWGRLTDGHESRTSSTTATNSPTDVPGHASFILETLSPWDWRAPSQNDNLWQGVSGTNNNPCPSGFRLPTDAEWETERLSWSSNKAAGAFASPLKLVAAGYRNHNNGSLNYVGSDGYYWSSTVNGINSRYLDFYGTNAYMYSYYRASGFTVRCLKD